MDRPQESLLVATGSAVCALPLTDVVEVMRMLPVERLPGAPDAVIGVSTIRGEPTPVLDLAGLLGLEETEPPARLVTLDLEGRPVALAVTSVLGPRVIDEAMLREAEGLLDGGHEAITAIGRLDDRLVMYLRTVVLVPDDLLRIMEVSRA